MHLCTPDTRCAIADNNTLGVSTVTLDTILHHDLLNAMVETGKEPSFVVIMLQAW